MARSFITGRSSEQLYNEELYKLFKAIEHLLDTPQDTNVGPSGANPGSLWLDMQNSGDLKYYTGSQWKTMFSNKFKVFSELLNPAQPTDNIPGQLWLNDGILMYYNGVEWLPIKAVNVDAEFNMSSFEQFLIINPLPAAGNQVIVIDPDTGDQIYKTQFLVPSVILDKFFINGLFTNNYDKVSNVAIQYDSSNLQGKVASIVHMNPLKLTGVKKKVLLFDESNPVISVSESNTEFYGFKGGLGKLLLKAAKDDGNTYDYVSVPQGIQLLPPADTSKKLSDLYDFIMAVSYEFKNVKGTGYLESKTMPLSGTSSIYISQFTDPFCVFIQGMYLDDDPNNYTYDYSRGYLNLDLETQLNVQVVSFRRKEVGTITSKDGNNNGIINPITPFIEPLVFVYGETMNSGIADFTYDRDNKIIKVVNAIPGMKYAVVETKATEDEYDMIIKSAEHNNFKGIVPNPSVAGQEVSIPCPVNIVPADTRLILFVDGIMISSRDIKRLEDGSVTTYGLKPGQDYVILKDPDNRIVFDDIASFTTIPVGHLNDALVYIENHLVCDASSVFVTTTPEKGVEGEVKLLINGGEKKWIKYYKNNWEDIDPIVDDNLITILNESSSGYSTSTRSINILQNFGEADCTYYAYTFASSVEEPLLKGNIIVKPDAGGNISDTFKVAYNQPYTPGTNSLAVWVDGMRQYPNTSTNPEIINGVEELNDREFKLLSKPAQSSNIFYTIEKPEGTETQSCQKAILTYQDRIPGAPNMYDCFNKVSLMPGNVRVYVGGYRLPATSFRVIDSMTLMINFPIVGGMDNYPIEYIQNKDGSVIEIPHIVSDEILVEVRQDFSIREITLPIFRNNRGRFSQQLYDDAPEKYRIHIPDSLFESRDFIMIYINGAAYGKDFVVNETTKEIVLTNQNVADCFVDPIEQFYETNLTDYPNWREHYIPKEVVGYITFEWR